MEKITPCGDNCSVCPRYLAKTEEQLKRVAELWFRIGLRDHVPSKEEIRCLGCAPYKPCTYQLVTCVQEKHVKKCNQCSQFPRAKIQDMLKRSKDYEKKCKAVCTDEEYHMLKAAFFRKEEYLKK